MYSETFKKNIVKLYRMDTRVSDLHRDYNVSKSAIYRWIHDLSEEDMEDIVSIDVKALEQENMQLKEEIKALKTTINILTKEELHYIQTFFT